MLFNFLRKMTCSLTWFWYRINCRSVVFMLYIWKARNTLLDEFCASKIDKTTNKMHYFCILAKLDGVKTYMRIRRVPKNIQNKVIKWFDYLWLTQNSSDEERAIQCLPGICKLLQTSKLCMSLIWNSGINLILHCLQHAFEICGCIEIVVSTNLL